MVFNATRYKQERSEGLIFRKKYIVHIGEYEIELNNEEIQQFKKLLMQDEREDKRSKRRLLEYNTDEKYLLGIEMAYQGPKYEYDTGGGLDGLLRGGTWLWDLYDDAKKGKKTKIKIVTKNKEDMENWEYNFINKIDLLKREANK